MAARNEATPCDSEIFSTAQSTVINESAVDDSMSSLTLRVTSLTVELADVHAAGVSDTDARELESNKLHDVRCDTVD